MDDTLDISGLVDEFLEDAVGHVDSIETALLELEKRREDGMIDDGLIIRMLGNLHTLKGNAGMMGISSIQQYSHMLESVLKKVQEGVLHLSSAVFELFYGAITTLRNGLAGIAANHQFLPDFADDITALEILLIGSEGPAGDMLVGNDFQLQASNTPPDDFTSLTQKSSVLKVSFEKLDELLNLVGELVIHRTALDNLGKKLLEKGVERDLMEAFSEVNQQIGKSSSNLREAIMKARMLPIETVFQRFRRLVRDHSRKSGKDIMLRFTGEDTEIDKTVIDEIGEPLIHLIRNAIDHGFESVTERRHAGKPAAGQLTLSACQESNHIVIAVDDDGRGMSVNRIRESAVSKGLLGRGEAELLTDHETYQLIFAAGFSTNSEVTETSGRGIGLDVVKKTVASLNGSVEIASVWGKGSRFTIRLPLTLAIIQALMVEVGGDIFAIPLAGVLESVRMDATDFHQIGAGEVINLRDHLLPIRRLATLFGLPQDHDNNQEYVVIVESDDKQCGLVVDRLIGQQEIVIKALDDYLGELPGIAGGTILGDGRIAMIVDTGAVISGLKTAGQEVTVAPAGSGVTHG